VTKEEELRSEIERLQGEQRRLQEEQDKLRTQALHGNGHNEERPEQSDHGGEHEQEEKNRPVRKRAPGWVRRHPGTALVALVLLVILVVGGTMLWAYFRSYESTDDAQIDGHLNWISPRIRGTTVAVYVENNEYVQLGQTLVDLDPRDYAVALKQAEGTYQQAQAQLQAAHPNVPIVQTTTQTTVTNAQAEIVVAQKAVAAAEHDYEASVAELRQAEAQNMKAQDDVRRFEPLARKEEISRQQFESYVTTARTTASAVDAARAAVGVAARTLEQRRAQLMEAENRAAEAQKTAPHQVAMTNAEVETRRAGTLPPKAAVDQARLNLSYTKILAPVPGVITNRTVEVGQALQAGQELLAISQIDDLWVTANFKETQVRRMRPGQSADIHVDAFDTVVHGYIESLPGTTGARTSLLPPENATGNYVKVVQRLPVRIRFKSGEDRQHRLRIGMSVEPKVRIY